MEVRTIEEALDWASARTPRMLVIVDGLDEVWDAPPPEEDRRRIDAHIERSRRRHQRERRVYAEPVEWFFAVHDPEVEDVEALCVAAAQAPAVLAARVHRATPRRRPETWLVLRVLARSSDQASEVGSRVLVPIVWPEERIEAVFGDGAFFLSVGHQVTGLAECEADALA